jgi:hypothetical protein
VRGPRRRANAPRWPRRRQPPSLSTKPPIAPQPDARVPRGSVPANDAHSGDSATGHRNTSIISAIVTGIAVIAAIAAIPSWGALLAFPLGAAAVAGAVFAWRLAGGKRILCLGGAGALFVAFFIVLLISAPRNGQSSGTEANRPTQPSAAPERPRSVTSPPDQPSPTTENQPSSTPSSSPTQRGKVAADFKPVKARLTTGHSRGFFKNHVLVGIDDVYGDFANISVSTKSLSCTFNPSVGQYSEFGSASDGYYRITLKTIDTSNSVTVEVQQAPNNLSGIIAFC